MPREETGADTLAGLRGVRRRVERPDRRPEDAGEGQMGLLCGEVQAPVDEEPRGESVAAGVRRNAGVALPRRVAAGVAREGIDEELRDERPAMEVRSAAAVWGVRALVGKLRERVEGTFREVMVEGEISACRPASSGHLYLTLKEGEAQLSVVLFRRQAQLLRFRPQQGMAVLARGRLSVFEGRGELQLLAETLEPRGTGALLLAFERLKEKLGREGLFAPERKRALPAYPRCVGVVTSTAGAVLHDVIHVVRRRHARLNLLVYPASVQGPGCASSVTAGVRWFNAHPGVVDVILLARGGGSPEDLCGFNDEGLARAIADSALPVVSAVGHETDFSIADFVADLRAPTPSAAAEMITASQHKVAERVEGAERALLRALRYRLVVARERFARASAGRLRARVEAALDRRSQRLDELQRRLEKAFGAQQAGRRLRLGRMEQALGRQQVGPRLQRDRERLERLEQWLQYWGAMVGERRRPRLEKLSARLGAMSPLAVLERGYALVYAVHESTVSGEEKASQIRQTLLRSSAETKAGQRIVARLARGTIEADVFAVQAERDNG